MRIEIHHHHHVGLGPEVQAQFKTLNLKLDFILANQETMIMATKEQLDRLRVDVAALLDTAVKTITEAVAEAQQAPPDQADAAIDQLDTDVKAATQSIKDASTKLKTPPA